MNFEVENQILVQENSRIHKENCYLQHFNSDLTSKLNEFRCKVENLLVELNEIPQGFRLNDAFKIKGIKKKDKYFVSSTTSEFFLFIKRFKKYTII